MAENLLPQSTAQTKSYPAKRVIVFDLDGTLAESKQPVSAEMCHLLEHTSIARTLAVISGGKWEQFQKQFLASFIVGGEFFQDVVLLPTSGASMYCYRKQQWVPLYQHNLNVEDIALIYTAFSRAFEKYSFPNGRGEGQFGRYLEFRGAQLTFSACGQLAPVEVKKAWAKENEPIRQGIFNYVSGYLTDYSVRLGGLTSIDVTRKGMDKAFGIEKLMEHCGVAKEEVLFVGDALYKGGNDYPVKEMGVDCVETDGPVKTMEIIRGLLETGDRDDSSASS